MLPESGITPCGPVWRQRKQRKGDKMPAQQRNGADGNWKNSRPLTEQQGKNTETFQDCQKRHQARGRVVFCRFSSRFSSNNIACFRLSICESLEARRVFSFLFQNVNDLFITVRSDCVTLSTDLFFLLFNGYGRKGTKHP